MSDQFTETLKRVYPSLTLQRWFCRSHPPNLEEFHRMSINDPDQVTCHECFEMTRKEACIDCRLATCCQSVSGDRMCLGCVDDNSVEYL